jgi:hypothetical protein
MGLLLRKYISVIQLTNPMHRLWSDGRWNKLTMAHGCYWGKCTFCDVSLDYIQRYEASSAARIVDRMEELIAQTGDRGFHFVDEAAPPALMKAVALEILRRGVVATWWTNIRFEKSFTLDLCRLLAASGCIAVSGGLEVASDRLLKLIAKGVTIEQVTRVNDHCNRAGARSGASDVRGRGDAVGLLAPICHDSAQPGGSGTREVPREEHEPCSRQFRQQRPSAR